MSTDTTTAPAVRRHRPPPRPLAGRPGVPFAPHPAGRAPQDGRHPRRALDGHRDGRRRPSSSWPPSSSGARPRTRRSAACSSSATLPLAMLLPVIGIMAATAEWTQRTGLVTFTLEPRRGRVVLAKALAALACAWSCWSPLLPRRPSPTWPAAPASGTSTAAAAGGARAGAAGLRPAGRRVRPAVPQHAGRDRVGAGAADRLVDRHAGLSSRCEQVGAWLDLDSVTRPLFAGEMAGQDWAQLGDGESRCGCCSRWPSAPTGCCTAR